LFGRDLYKDRTGGVTTLLSVYQLGVCAGQVDAVGRSRLCRESAGDPIVEAIRALLSGQPVGNDIWIALAWCVGIMLVAYVFAMRVYKKRV
jgi:hypothetical protein